MVKRLCLNFKKNLLLAFFLLITSFAFMNNVSAVSITFIKIPNGQANGYDSILIEDGNDFGLIDVGDSGALTYIKKVLNKNITAGKKLRFLVITHNDSDHKGGSNAYGANDIIDTYKPDYVYVKNDAITNLDVSYCLSDCDTANPTMGDSTLISLTFDEEKDDIKSYYSFRTEFGETTTITNPGGSTTTSFTYFPNISAINFYNKKRNYNRATDDRTRGGANNGDSIVTLIEANGKRAALFADMSYSSAVSIAEAIGDVDLYQVMHHGMVTLSYKDSKIVVKEKGKEKKKVCQGPDKKEYGRLEYKVGKKKKTKYLCMWKENGLKKTSTGVVKKLKPEICVITGPNTLRTKPFYKWAKSKYKKCTIKYSSKKQYVYEFK